MFKKLFLNVLLLHWTKFQVLLHFYQFASLGIRICVYVCLSICLRVCVFVFECMHGYVWPLCEHINSFICSLLQGVKALFIKFGAIESVRFRCAVRVHVRVSPIYNVWQIQVLTINGLTIYLKCVLLYPEPVLLWVEQYFWCDFERFLMPESHQLLQWIWRLH